MRAIRKPLMDHEEGAEDGHQRTMRPLTSKASTWATTYLLVFEYRMRIHRLVLSFLVMLSNGIAEQVLFSLLKQETKAEELPVEAAAACLVCSLSTRMLVFPSLSQFARDTGLGHRQGCL